MYFRVVQPCQFYGREWRVGDVINLADPSLCAQLQQECGEAVVLTDDPTPAVEKSKVEKPKVVKPQAAEPKVTKHK